VREVERVPHLVRDDALEADAVGSFAWIPGPLRTIHASRISGPSGSTKSMFVIPSTPVGGSPKKFVMMLPSVSKTTSIPPPFHVPMTDSMKSASTSPRPIREKSPARVPRNEEVGTLDHWPVA
jgi:hypothetical protein